MMSSHPYFLVKPKPLNTSPVPDYQSPRFWGQACIAPKGSFENTESTTIEEERCHSIRISLLDCLETSIYDSPSPAYLKISDDEVKLAWDLPSIAPTQILLNIKLYLIPAFEEALMEFKKTLSEATHHSPEKKITDPQAILCSIRLSFFESCLKMIKKETSLFFAQENTENTDTQETSIILTDKSLRNIQYLTNLSLSIALQTESIFKDEQTADISALPDFRSFREDLQRALNEKDQDPDTRVREWVLLQECINESLPESLQLQLDENGNLRIPNSQHWRDICKAGQEKRFIWTLENGFLPGLTDGLKSFIEKCDETMRPPQQLETHFSEDEWAAFKGFIKALNLLEMQIRISKDFILDEDPLAFGEAFQEHLKLLASIHHEIQELRKQEASSDRQLLLFQTQKAIQEECAIEDPDKSITASLQFTLQYLLKKISQTHHKKTCLDWEIIPENPLEGAKEIHLPGFIPGLPAIFSPPNMNSFPDLSAQ